MTMSSTKGMKTSFWGPHAWAFLFSSIAGAYPVKVDPANRDHVATVRAFKAMIKSLEYTLPCSFCRKSYRGFLKELPLSSYEHSRHSMMYWMYLLRDKVNQKLIKQEQECLNQEKQKIRSKNPKPVIKKLREQILKTKKSPPFETVLARYERQRAGCSKKSAFCA